MNKLLFVFLIYIYCTGFVVAEPVRLATTTSTENSGLLKVLIPYFEKQTGNVVHILSFGTGQALRMGQEGNVDVVLVHAPKDEMRFVDAGYGLNRRSLMFNDFVIVGPANDPANILGENNAVRSLQKIARGKHLFVSRGDDSPGLIKRSFISGIKQIGNRNSYGIEK
jgi:tungstate transport system substrate-binding protein